MERNRRKRIFRKIHEKLGCETLFADRRGYILDSSEVSRIGQSLRIPVNIPEKRFFTDGGLLVYALSAGENVVQFVGIPEATAGAETLLKLIGVMLMDELEEMTREDFILEALNGKFPEEQMLYYMKRFNLPMYQRIQVLIVQIKVEHGDDVEFILNTLFPGEPVLRISSARYGIIRKPDKMTGDEAARRIYQSIYSELMFVPAVGIGTEGENFLALKESYEKAIKALEIGILHDPQSGIYSYRKLAVPLLIDHMKPDEIERLYRDTADNINSVINDEELIVTALRFFENDLNITETSRKLYVHRNTLIYRLNKVNKLTGYDLRHFEDALNFSIALNLQNVLKNNAG